MIEAKPRAAVPLAGEEVETGFGKHLERQRLYPFEARHGSVTVERLREFAGGEQVFLDTETTGLAGGSGTLAFLIGTAEVTADGLLLRQWFVREHGEEASALSALATYLARFTTLVTYNGCGYDQPLLEARYTLARQRSPFPRLEHNDLLYDSRRLWKLRFDSCRLVELERRILGHERVGDVPGELIPHLYFEYLRTRDATKLEAVVEHNALDIVSLAFLTAIVAPVFANPLGCPLTHGAELCGLARWLAAERRYEEAAQLYRRAIDAPISDDLMFRSLWDLAQLERRLERIDRALIVWTDLSQSKNPYRGEALIELAKYYEHRERNFFMALECTLAAREWLRGESDRAEIENRRVRLESKIARPRARRLL
jgi:hypothetical protein